ncbi:MAG: lasso peptide biosynthesis B2 protein [Asticcacaulis sp.]|uniref:lasso peptide biosynthesis B2 protein n=1 Tax=Asticcacaulis sp. TaxID=1872648 RepID=UPI0039E5DD28
MGFALPSHQYVCIANHRCVFLNLAQDRYFCLPPDLESPFLSLLSGAEPPNAGTRDIERLVELGVIVPSVTHDLTSPSREVLARTSSRFDVLHSAPNPWLVLRAVLSQRRATRDLSRLPLLSVLTSLREAKAQDGQRHGNTPIPSRHIAAYRTATRILSSQDQCLRTAVGFTRLLNRDGYFPNMVIGVRMSPFRAHAWVQDRGTVLTDTLDTVLPFTPILVI